MLWIGGYWSLVKELKLGRCKPAQNTSQEDSAQVYRVSLFKDSAMSVENPLVYQFSASCKSWSSFQYHPYPNFIIFTYNILLHDLDEYCNTYPDFNLFAF